MVETYAEGKDVFVEPNHANESFGSLLTKIGRTNWEPYLVPDKEEADRYRIERTDDHRILYPRRAFNEKFVPFTNERISLLGTAIFDDNSTLNVKEVVSTGYGEKLLVKAKIDIDLDSEVKGVGKIEPSLIMVFNAASPTAKLAFTYKQLFCDNQIPSLASDPLARVLELDNKATDELLIQNCGKLRGYIDANVHTMLNTLVTLGKTLVTTRSIITLFSLTFGVYDIESERPKLVETLLDHYDNAPNAAPGTLLGGINAITHYFVQYDHKTQRLARMATLPTSTQNAKVKKAMKIVCEASKFDNVDSYFDVLV